MSTTSVVIKGDAVTLLKDMDEQSVRCCVTSPPYWGLRDYGTEGQLGLEASPDLYVARMVGVFREVRRVLADDGTLWLNLGDSYAAQRGGTKMPAETLAGGIGGYGGAKAFRGRPTDTLGGRQDESSPEFRTGPVAHRNASAFGLKHKDLVGIPWRVALALQADGWYLRSDIIWHKPNPMPESVTDRPTKAHEYLFLLTKSARYHYDHEAVLEAAVDQETIKGRRARKSDRISDSGDGGYDGHRTRNGLTSRSSDGKTTRNRRTVWTINTKPFKGAHFAVMPEALVEPCILAGSAEGDLVLDPFAGSGTVGVVALRHRRDFIGFDLNKDYVKMAKARIHASQNGA